MNRPPQPPRPRPVGRLARVQVTVRYFAAAKARVGRAEETVELTSGTSIGELLVTTGFAGDAVFDRCSFLVNGESRPRKSGLRDGDRLDVLPPFAGG